MNETTENLRKAFAGESQANRRYLAFARKAEEEGFTQTAKLFKAAAEAETIHALNHLKRLGETKSTVENLQAAVSGENYEHTRMYPEFIKIAKQEGIQQAVWSFDVANQVEKIHSNLFSQMVSDLKNGRKLVEMDYYVCRVCGNTVEDRPPEKCPVCGASRTKFFKAG